MLQGQLTAPCWRSACALLRPLQGIACWPRLPSADLAGVGPELPVCMGTAEYCSGHYLPLYRDTARPYASSDPAAGTRPVTASCSHRLTPALATLALQGHVQAEAQLAVVSGDLGHRGQHHKGPNGSQALLVCKALEAQAWLSELLLQCFWHVVSCSGRQNKQHRACMLVCQAALCCNSQRQFAQTGERYVDSRAAMS